MSKQRSASVKLPSKMFVLFLYSFFTLGTICPSKQLNASSSVTTIEDVEYEKKSTLVIKKFISEYQGGRFTYISNGCFEHFPKGTDFGVWVTAKTKETIQSGRVLACTFTKAYYTELQKNEYTLKWYECLREFLPNRYTPTLTLKNVGLRLAFWDEAVERPKAPYLAEIDFYDNRFYYYEADPQTQSLKLVLDETYEQAIAILENKS